MNEIDVFEPLLQLMTADIDVSVEEVKQSYLYVIMVADIKFHVKRYTSSDRGPENEYKTGNRYRMLGFNVPMMIIPREYDSRTTVIGVFKHTYMINMPLLLIQDIPGAEPISLPGIDDFVRRKDTLLTKPVNTISRDVMYVLGKVLCTDLLLGMLDRFTQIHFYLGDEIEEDIEYINRIYGHVDEFKRMRHKELRRDPYINTGNILIENGHVWLIDNNVEGPSLLHKASDPKQFYFIMKSIHDVFSVDDDRIAEFIQEFNDMKAMLNDPPL